MLIFNTNAVTSSINEVYNLRRSHENVQAECGRKLARLIGHIARTNGITVEQLYKDIEVVNRAEKLNYDGQLKLLETLREHGRHSAGSSTKEQ